MAALLHLLRPATSAATVRRTGIVTGIVARLVAALDLRRQRHHLARLEPHLLRDIGVTEGEAAEEAGRPAWDAPRHWRG